MSTHSTTSDIAHIRKDYKLAALEESAVGDDPLAFFTKWFAEAEIAKIDEVNAMTLATVDSNHKPHARIVLLKGLNDKGLVFYTNYDSAKGKELAANPFATVVFFWKELERQVRFEGRIEKVPTAESDEYFHSRPMGSQIGAWASPQSSMIHDRTIIEENYQTYEQQFKNIGITRPEHWGGYCLFPEKIEFWQGRSNRMHDRIVFEMQPKHGWKKYRVAP
ncbi:MAG: pyridoxamine 5'-phosphate oxidase [Bacteroidota bacterium]